MKESVVFPRNIFKYIWERSRESAEVGFFLIGISWRNKYIVYDALEFQYAYRSSTFVSHEPHMKNLIIQCLIPMQKLLGNAHSHPFSEIPSPSGIDLATWRGYEEGIFLIFGKNDIICVKVAHGEIEPIDIEIRSLLPEETPRHIAIGRWKIVFPAGMNHSELMLHIPPELSKLVVREIKLAKIAINPTKRVLRISWPNYVEVTHNYASYRIYFKGKSDLHEKLKTLFGCEHFKTAYRSSLNDN